MNNFDIGRNAEKNVLDDERVTMTYSGVFTRDKQKVVHVCFERKETGAFAEAVIPECRFLHNQGFAPKELETLKVYLQMNKDEIFQNARGINRNVLFRL